MTDVSGHEHCLAGCCSECWERFQNADPQMSDAERAVIEAAKAWNNYNGCSPDEYCRLASALHLAVDALEAKQ